MSILTQWKENYQSESLRKIEGEYKTVHFRLFVIR
ncbi:hypothetical protein RUMGNA_03082 [Mediterraneibacter gnavus ATCC 29149]|uniref:Uncharacterized protein n=1 Tax=Mediterraneibacter gnavus (strain ATCC 29149 / DSM 114966 / JCM 6515 / VPI C7-9) TaxID=411470 RepID=A7B671_MEDG7|nr:hypothetical protein RUMGNA_03082 [Mediterraneibacter gnavus ATCC 29149]